MVMFRRWKERLDALQHEIDSLEQADAMRSSALAARIDRELAELRGDVRAVRATLDQLLLRGTGEPGEAPPGLSRLLRGAAEPDPQETEEEKQIREDTEQFVKAFRQMQE